MRLYITFLIVLFFFTQLNGMSDELDAVSGDSSEEIFYKKLSKAIIDKLDPERAGSIEVEHLMRSIQNFVMEKVITNPFSVTDKNKFRSFLLDNREEFLDSLGIEGISRRNFKSIIDDHLNYRRRFGTCCKCATISGIIIFAVIIIYFVFWVLDKLRHHCDFNIALDIDFPDLPDLPNIPDVPDVPVPDFN